MSSFNQAPSGGDVDLACVTLRELNAQLHARAGSNQTATWRVRNPRGAHAIAVGLDAPLTVEIAGHVGYYCAGMNQRATVLIEGNAGAGVAENMMSGTVRVRGDASQNAGATARGGLLVIEGSASSRCGISMKGVDIVVVNRLDPGPRLDINMYTDGHTAHDARALPPNLLEALRELDGSAVLRAALGNAFVDAYLKLRRAEWETYAAHLSSWETDTTFDC